MSKPWPDELRQMVDALMHGGACPSVYGCSDGGWRIHTGRAWADYSAESGRWWFDGSFRNAAVVLAELLQRSDTVDARYALQERIHAAVPGALVAIWSDGIEVSVGSKSVRWKREKNGWSLGDDLFTSEDKVIEHAKAMAVEAAAETQWALAIDLATRLKAKGIETCTVRNLDTGVVTVSAKDSLGHWHSAELRDGRWHHGDVVLTTTAEAYRVLLEAVAPKLAAPQPSPRAQALLGALRAQGYEPKYKRYDDVHEIVFCESEMANARSDEALWWYLTAQASTEYVAEQMHLRLSRKRSATTSATISGADKTNVLDTAAAMRAAGEAMHAAKGTTTMTQPKTTTQALIQTATADASEAAWRTAGSQFVKLAREPLVGLLTRHLAPNDDAFRARLAAFLETELGTALLASMLSATLSALPQTTGEVPQKLARELRVRAMADAGDVMADVLMGPLRQVMALYLQDPAGAPAAAPALDAPQSTGLEWATQGEKVAK